MTWRMLWLIAAPPVVTHAMLQPAVARHVTASPAFEIHLLSTVPEKRRTLTFTQFAKAMKACTFFGGANPLRDLRLRADVPYSYGGKCAGPDALSPELEVEFRFEEIYIKPDFSDGPIDKLAAAIKAQDNVALAALFTPSAGITYRNVKGADDGYESDARKNFVAFLDRLREKYGNVTEAYCKKWRVTEVHFYMASHDCFVKFERLSKPMGVRLEPSASEIGIDDVIVDAEDIGKDAAP